MRLFWLCHNNKKESKIKVESYCYDNAPKKNVDKQTREQTHKQKHNKKFQTRKGGGEVQNKRKQANQW